MLTAELTGRNPGFRFAKNTDDLFVGKTLLHGDVLMWLMKTLLTSRCVNQRVAGQMDVVRDGVFQHFSQLGQADKTKVILLGNFMKDARLEIVKPPLLIKAVEVIKNLPQAEYNGERSTNPGIA